MNIVADFWEEHCVECGEPVCYASCATYAPARTGRCKRFSFDTGSGVHEWRTGMRTIAFRPWGKLELLWHGKMAPPFTRKFLLLLNGLVEPVALLLGRGVYKIWRSVRWRIGMALARRPRAPAVWKIACRAEQDELLVASVANASGNEVFRREMQLKASVPFSTEWRLPTVERDALFRISSYDGTKGKVTFERLALLDVTASAIKCVAWDLDGTLWDGVLVEDGFDGLRLKPEILELIKRFDSHGVVNSVISKNDTNVAIDALKRFGVEEYFVFPQIGWEAKSVALRRLARQMNIGIDAIAFVDDTEHERIEVKAECPEATVAAPEDAAALADTVYQQGSQLGSERRKMYRDEMARGKVVANDFGGDAEAFLAASNLAVELLDVTSGGDVAARCRELLQRTNQLTLTAHRYDEAAFDALLNDATCKAVRAHDKYGDFGIVGFVAWTPDRLRELVFSCRIAKKGVERRVLDLLPKGLVVDMVETDRNVPIREIVKEWMGVGRSGSGKV